MTYLIDLVFLLLAPVHPALIVMAVLQYIARRSPLVATGFWQLAGAPDLNWVWIAVLPGLSVHMSNKTKVEDEQNNNQEAPILPATTTTATSNNGIAITQNDSNGLLLTAKAEALAALVKAGKVGETEGIKLVFGVSPSSSNPRYQAARAALKAELAKNNYPPLRPEQQALRQHLGLEK
jgi:hypothetical protein